MGSLQNQLQICYNKLYYSRIYISPVLLLLAVMHSFINYLLKACSSPVRSVPCLPGMLIGPISPYYKYGERSPFPQNLGFARFRGDSVEAEAITPQALVVEAPWLQATTIDALLLGCASLLVRRGEETRVWEMSIEEIKCNGKVKEKKLSSNDGFVTYRRKKRMRTCERDENGGVSANPMDKRRERWHLNVFLPQLHIDNLLWASLRYLLLWKVNERFQETRLLTEIYEEGDIDRTDKHWRTVLKEMPQLPVVWESGGILSSIKGALKSCPPSDNRKSEMTDILGKSKMTDIPTDTVLPKERHKNHYGVPGQSTLPDMEEAGINDQTDEIANQQECQDAFLSILRSEKFVLLSNLLFENFQGIKIDRLFDLNLINSKIENGVYRQSPGLFNQDLQQMWGKIQKLVEELVLLASSLSNMSQYIRLKQLSSQVNFVAKNSNDSDIATIPISRVSPFHQTKSTRGSLSLQSLHVQEVWHASRRQVPSYLR